MEPIYAEYRDYKWWEGILEGYAEERTVYQGRAYFKYLTTHTPDGEVLVVLGPTKYAKPLAPAGEAE